MTFPPGKRLGPYEIVSLLGAGGMGEVYRARDPRLGRDVAIKVLPEEFSQDEERLSRLEREAKLLASLNHASIATLFGLEESDGLRVLVMELVEGETLRERIARSPVPIDEAVPFFTQIAEGLEAAHEKGVIHRDLKPANIKVTPEGRIKILDFGLAKSFRDENAPEGSQSESPTLSRETATGVLLGTAPYMSPEQARGKRVDKRTDVWAFGCCLYEALTGRPPFAGETVSDTIARILEREPAWEALPKTTPAALRRLLTRCLRKDPRRRLHDLADVRIELEEATVEVSSQRAGSPPQGKARLAVFFVLGIALGVVLGSILRPSATRDVRIVRSEIPVDPAPGLTMMPSNPSLAISPGGDRIAFVGGQWPSQRLYLRSLSEPTARIVEGTLGAEMPFFSPDGSWLGFVRGRALMKVSVSGGAPVSIVDYGSAPPRGASWGADGWIVYNRAYNSGLSRVRAEGGEPEILTTPDPAKREKTHRFPESVPGGKAVLFALGTVDITSHDDASIAVLDLETGEIRILLEGGMSPRLSSTGHLVYARDGKLLAAPFDPEVLEILGPPIPVVTGVATYPAAGNAEFALSANGALVYQPGDSWGNDKGIASVDRGGRTVPLLDARRAYAGSMRYSPDGRLLAFSIEGANSSVWVYDISRGTMGRLSAAFTNNSPVWTPDGERIAFRSDREGVHNLYLQTVRGTEEAERLAESMYLQTPGSWSPDGRLLVFDEAHPENGLDLWILDLVDGRVTKRYLQTKFNEQDPQLSPDGTWIAYQSDASGRDEIYIGTFPASTQRWQVSTDGGTAPRWRGDGRELFYRNGPKLMAVEVRSGAELVLGKPVELFETPDGIATDFYDVAPDGERFVMVDERAEPFAPHLNLVLNWSEELKRLVPRKNEP